MPATPVSRERRAPRPWWLRLGAWLVALAVVAAAGWFVIARGSYDATTHTVADAPPRFDRTPPSGALSTIGSFENGYLAGPVVAEIDEHGVIAREPRTGAELWRYVREDAEVCAHEATDSRVVLVYATADRCDQAIALDSGSGARQWMRTLETGGSNQIRITADGILSIAPERVVDYELSQGYERFTLDAAPGETGGGQATCENVDAAGAGTLVVLQRCRSDEQSAWNEHLVVERASDGKPQEIGRSYLSGLDSPELVGATAEGDAFVRDVSGAVHYVPVGATETTAVSGLPPVTEVSLVAGRGALLLVADGTAYALDATRTAVAWSVPVLAAPSAAEQSLLIPVPDGVETRDASGRTVGTVAFDLSALHPSAVRVSGSLIGVRSGRTLTVLG